MNESIHHKLSPRLSRLNLNGLGIDPETRALELRLDQTAKIAEFLDMDHFELVDLLLKPTTIPKTYPENLNS